METIETFKIVYKRFLDSNQTARDFCHAEGIGESHFFYWQRKLRKEVTRHSSFMPVSVNSRCGNKLVISKCTDHQAMPVHDSCIPKCEIIYPNGVMVRLTGVTSLESVRMLIGGSRM